MRTIKFRAWFKPLKRMYTVRDLKFQRNGNITVITHHTGGTFPVTYEIMQFTGLKDKNGKVYIYEGDIIDIKGQIIGNKYENKNLLKEKTNFLIEGLFTSSWCKTYKKAMERGCKNA